MLINHITTSSDLNPAQPISIKEIVQEVSRHGFYAAELASLAPQALTSEDATAMASALAQKMGLRVSINHATKLCVFER